MNRLVTAVAIGMRRIAGKTQTFTGVYGLPYPTSTHVQPTLNHHHMFDNAGFMRLRRDNELTKVGFGGIWWNYV